MFNIKVLNCKECGLDFEFSAAEQESFAQKGFTNAPGRCTECRAARKTQTRGQGGGGGYVRQERQIFPAVCATCGKECTVPFQPSENRPVYCRECYVPTRNNY